MFIVKFWIDHINEFGYLAYFLRKILTIFTKVNLSTEYRSIIKQTLETYPKYSSKRNKKYTYAINPNAIFYKADQNWIGENLIEEGEKYDSNQGFIVSQFILGDSFDVKYLYDKKGNYLRGLFIYDDSWRIFDDKPSNYLSPY